MSKRSAQSHNKSLVSKIPQYFEKLRAEHDIYAIAGPSSKKIKSDQTIPSNFYHACLLEQAELQIPDQCEELQIPDQCDESAEISLIEVDEEFEESGAIEGEKVAEKVCSNYEIEVKFSLHLVFFKSVDFVLIVAFIVILPLSFYIL